MHTSRLSKYTLADIQNAFKSHPILVKLNSTERKTVFNQAQNEIARLVENVYQLTNYTIADNRITYTYDRERNLINDLTPQEKSDLRLGTRPFSQLRSLIDLSYELSESEKDFVLNVAQDMLARVKNDYDTLGYYQLWYNIDADIQFALFKDSMGMNSSFNTAVAPRSYTTVGDITAWQDPGEIIGKLDFKSAFSTYVSYIRMTYVYDDLDFKTTFTTLVEGPNQYDVTLNNLDFKTTFTTTVVAPVIYEHIDDGLDFHTTFVTAVA